MTTRNQIFAAMLALGAGITWGSPPNVIAHSTRRPRTPDKMRGFMPCLCQSEYKTSTTQKRGMPQLRLLDGAWLYMLYEADDDAVPAYQIADLLDAVDALFPSEGESAPFVGGPQTLGGLVYKVEINGETEVWGGNIDSQILICVPWRVTAVSAP